MHVRKPQEEILRLFPSLRVEEPLEVAHEVLRGVQRFPNPVPPKNDGGDCFACASWAGINHLFPEKKITWEALYTCWESKTQPGIYRNTWGQYLDVLDRMAQDFELPLERGILFTPPYIAWDVEKAEPSWFRATSEVHWWRDLQAYLSAGWLALAHVNQFGSGPYVFEPGEQQGFTHNTNHVVLLDGARQVKRRVPQPKWWREKYPEDDPMQDVWDYEVHVVDSAQSDQTGWHSLRLWLFRHGASALHIFRRHDRKGCVGMMGPVYSTT